MYKETIIIIIIIILIILGDIITQKYTEKTVSEISIGLYELKDYISQNKEEKYKKIENIEEKWEKMMKNNNNTLIDNIEMVKMKAAEIEEKAKMKEKLINVNGEVDVKMQENVSGMLIDAIKAKLTILENISKHN